MNTVQKGTQFSLEGLLQCADPWQGAALRGHGGGETTGFAELDECLVGSGWPRGALTELLPERFGIGELRLLMPTLARLSRGPHWVSWIDPPCMPCAAGLHARGVDLTHTLVVHPRDSREGLRALEQVLRSGTSAAVLAWPGPLDEDALWRLQLAAEAGDCVALLLRDAGARNSPSPAALRLALATERGGLRIDILKQRGDYSPEALHLPATGLFEPDRGR